MPLKEDSIRVVTSGGSAECFVCDKPITRGEKAVEVEFTLFLTIRKELHAGGCAEKLCSLLMSKAMEARR